MEKNKSRNRTSSSQNNRSSFNLRVTIAQRIVLKGDGLSKLLEFEVVFVRGCDEFRLE